MDKSYTKERILYIIHQEDIMRTAHNHLVDSLVGSLHTEYTGQFTESKALNLGMSPPPIFRAVVNMLISQMMHHFAETIIERMVDIIVRDQQGDSQNG